MYRIMIVDDEPIIRKGLSTLIDWQAYNCQIVFQAVDGLDAINNIDCFKPSIVITDIKMPCMDGLSLAEYIHTNYKSIKTIILTGYADFEYAISGIKFGVVDFILKPTTNEKIIVAVEKAKIAINNENSKQMMIESLILDVQESKTIMREKYIREIIEGLIKIDEQILQNLIELDIKLECFYLLKFKLEPIEIIDSQKYKNRPDSINVKVYKNLLATAFKDINYYTIFLSHDSFCLIASFDDYQAKYFDMIMDISNEIIALSDNFMLHNIAIGISRNHNNVLELKTAYEEADMALANQFYDNTNNAIHTPMIDKLENKSYYPNEDIEKLIADISQGNTDKAINNIDSIFNKMLANLYSKVEIKDVCVLISSQCNRLISNYNISLSDISESLSNTYYKIIDCQRVSNLLIIIKNEIALVCDYLRNQKEETNYIIKKADLFLNQNYSSNISLSIIAKALHVNSSYLSRLYKKEKGINITEVLTSLRLEKAKELLRLNKYKTYEVANMVGIEDPAYFSLIFKKYVGFSPKDYKNIT